MARSKIKDRRRVNDYWAQKAQAENYPARSVYKLDEIDRRFGLLKAGHRVLDLGCRPGSWTKYASERIGPGGLVVGVDLNPTPELKAENVRLVQADVFELDPEFLAGLGPFDAVLSDMAPKTTGVKSADQARSAELAREAWALARAYLKPGGSFLFKYFQGPDLEPLFRELKNAFKTVRRVKPKSSRSFSPEIFGLGLGLKAVAEKDGGRADRR